MESHAPPVKVAAEDLGLPIRQPERARDDAFVSWLEGEAPDVAVVVAYGKLLPPRVLEIPPLGFLNLHFSLLPLYRGAAPVQRAIMNGDLETGVSIMKLTEGMDEGPVLARVPVRLGPEESAGELGDRLASIGAPLWAPLLAAYASGELQPEEQDHAAATYAPKISSEDARLDWHRGAAELHDLIRGLDPHPGAWTTIGSKRLKVWSSEVLPPGELGPGDVRAGDRVEVGTGSGALALGDVQLAGKRRMPAAEAVRGLRLAPGARFG
jgi:methionyl-tRNA formyltransferase